ncbi:MAG: tRNA uridine-5-carboxymethylaminomethyl(34) synthesis GTPase MnmE, partial [Caulobacteraceae bacterium]
MSETIFAPATAQGRAAVAIVRISGPQARAALKALIGPRLPPARAARLRKVRDGAGKTLDHALALWFPAPASYTGEDVAELHLHGGPAVVGAVTGALAALGLRLAEPGEFTRRAF